MCKKYNMGAKCTGQVPIEFEFYDEFDDMSSKKPNVIPPPYGSVIESSGSSHGIAMIEDQDEVSTEVMDERQFEIPVQKKILEKSAKNEMLYLLQDMQDQKNTRHEENMGKLARLNERTCSAFEKKKNGTKIY